MKRVYLVLISIALLLIATNWSSFKEWDREIGLQNSSITPVYLGLVFALVALWSLGRKAHALLRELLDQGIKIQRDIRLIDLKPIIFLTPLLFHSRKTVSTILEDGTELSHSYGYGTDFGWLLFVLGSLVFVLFQIVMKLEQFKESASDPITMSNPASPIGSA